MKASGKQEQQPKVVAALVPDARVDAARASLVTQLRAAGCVFAEDEATVLADAAESVEQLADMVLRRTAGIPLEHILGWAAFHGGTVIVLPHVFVPRRRTEFLVDCAAELIPVSASARKGSAGVVLDLCCGSGAVATALARMRPGILAHAADLDPAAVACARMNLGPLGGRVYGGDLFGALPAKLHGSIDVITANAPYVPTAELVFMPTEARLHEPVVALDGGSDGLALHRRIAVEAPVWLRQGGALLLETSSGQASKTMEILAENGFRAHAVHRPEIDATVVIGQLFP